MSRALLANPFDKTGLDRQFGRGQRQRLLGDPDGHAVDFEQDATGFYARHPQFRRAFARAHADFERFLRHRYVGEHANPDAPRALHMAGERTACGLDLARGDPSRLERFEAILAERKVDRARGEAVDAALMRLAEFGSYR